ncbi:hypothetical protein PRIPAC_82203, partial [Pristionchus pacificus]|uniref:Uncharacterized protein n=1 Tax=Pristionchus pacificus TaxID=54126 RepID=A0A8R1Z639_PRIPA
GVTIDQTRPCLQLYFIIYFLSILLPTMQCCRFIQLFLLSTFAFYTAHLLSYTSDKSSDEMMKARLESSLGDLQAQIDDVILTLFKIGGTPKEVLIIFYAIRRDINTFVSAVSDRVNVCSNVADARQEFLKFSDNISSFKRNVVNKASFPAQDRRLLKWTIADIQKTVQKIESQLVN